MKIQATLTLLTQVFLLVSLGDGFLLSFRSRQRKYVERAYVLHEKKGPLGGGSSNDVTPTPRSTAAFALMNSLTKKNPMFATRQLENDKNFLNLSSRDRAFSKLLLTTVERRQGQIDKVISKFVKSKQKKDRLSDKLCLCCIRLGAAQLLFLDTPPHAALQETVEVLRMHDRIKVSKPQINYVNAMLRSIDREGRREVEKSTTIFDNIAPWLAEEWLTTYGKEKTERILKASMEQSPIFISVNHVRDSTTEERATKLQAIQKLFSVNDQSANLLPHGSIEIPKEFHGAVSQWPLYEEGEWWVQDPSASLPAIALSNALCKENTAAVHVVDLCSAPGGKTSQLCSFGFGKVTAIEVSKRRTKALHENIKRLGMNDLCEIVVADGREWVPDNTNDSVQGVLADVPCSATGVGSRRPDVLRKSQQEINELITIQRQLAAHAVDDIIQPGGIMVYATCSLLKQESEEQVKWLLSRSEGAQLETLPFSPGEIPGFDTAIDKNGWLRVIPGALPGSLSYCDGFFVARLRRVA